MQQTFVSLRPICTKIERALVGTNWSYAAGNDRVRLSLLLFQEQERPTEINGRLPIERPRWEAEYAKYHTLEGGFLLQCFICSVDSSADVFKQREPTKRFLALELKYPSLLNSFGGSGKTFSGNQAATSTVPAR